MEYTINKNSQFNSLEISFAGIPDKAIRESLKALKFRWHAVKKIWYGYADEETIKELLTHGTISQDEAIKTIRKAENREDVLKEFTCTIHPDEGMYHGGWTGNRNGLSLKDKNKEIKKAFNRIYPDIKVLGTGKSFSGGDEINFTVKLPKKYLLDADALAFELWKHAHRYYWLGYKDENGQEKTIRAEQIPSCFEDAKDLMLRIATQKIEQTCSGRENNESYLNADGKQILKDLKTIADAFTFDKSTVEVDYFFHGTYMLINYEIAE